jgi:hypothetical protein
MTIKYHVYDFEFDVERFAQVLQARILPDNVVFVANMLSIDHSTLENWREGRYKDVKFPYPSMTNFLKIVNLLDLNPCDYFRLKDD